MKEVTIKLTKCTLVLTEPEIINALAAKPEVFQSAIKRGKGLLRAQTAERRENQVDRWKLYEWLQGNRIPENTASLVESMAVGELREGCIEFLLLRQREVQTID